MQKIVLVILVVSALAMGGCGAMTNTSTNTEASGDTGPPKTVVVERTVVEVPSKESVEYGDYGSDAYLDGLYEDCKAGDSVACEDLYIESPANSEYETFALSQPWPGETESATSYGDDPYLDGLYDDCESGDYGACEDLYMASPVNSEYELFALSQPWDSSEEASEIETLQSFVDKYYAYVEAEDWQGTYSMLDEQTQSQFTEDEWISAQAGWEAQNGNAPAASREVVNVYGGAPAYAIDIQIIRTDGQTTTVYKEVSYEDGEYKRHFSDEELASLEPFRP